MYAFLAICSCSVVLLFWSTDIFSNKTNNVLKIPDPYILDSCRSNKLRIAIIHLATLKAHWYATHAQAMNLFYARRHGYDFLSYSCPDRVDKAYLWDENDQVRANWCKPNLIIDNLHKYHYVMLLDSDAHVVDPSYTIEQFIEEHFTDNISIVFPKNCKTELDGGFHCWGNDEKDITGINIGMIVAKSSSDAIDVLKTWSDSVPKKECEKFVPPAWKHHWSANDQRCFSYLYSIYPRFRNIVRVLTTFQTKQTIAGGKYAWLKHYIGGGDQGATEIGDRIKKDFLTVAPQEMFMKPIALHETEPRWTKAESIVYGGGDLGVCSDVCVLRQTNKSTVKYSMYFSWRNQKSIGLTFSNDSVNWQTTPVLALGWKKHTDFPDWELHVNRPFVMKVGSKYLMWYTGQVLHESARIGYAESSDGIVWNRRNAPIMSPTLPWELNSVMCPHVVYDPVTKAFRMWYSGGYNNVPNAIGHAKSADGIHWTKTSESPVFGPEPKNEWEKDRVAAPAVVYNGEYYYMFYIGFKDINSAAIGVARSKNGLSGWQRYSKNPIISPSPGTWDADAVYKPYPIFSEGRWQLWFNGRNGDEERIGIATQEGFDLGFDA